MKGENVGLLDVSQQNKKGRGGAARQPERLGDAKVDLASYEWRRERPVESVQLGF